MNSYEQKTRLPKTFGRYCTLYNFFKVNKQLLCSSSPVFAEMIDSGIIESAGNKMVVKGFTYEIVNAVVKMLYGISPSLGQEDMLLLLQFCDVYDITVIKVSVLL